MESKCPICSIPAHQKCSACFAVSYCSPAHQKEHWKSHRRNCSYFVSKVDPENGKGLYASRDIKAGTVVLEESPLVFSPSFFSSPSETQFCVGCGVGMPKFHSLPSSRRCSKCNWPNCSSECFQLHRENECRIFKARKLVYPVSVFESDFQMALLVLLIRASVAKKKHPDRFRQIFQLRSTFERDENDPSYPIMESMPRHLQPFITAEDFGIGVKDFENLFGILWFNCFSSMCRAVMGLAHSHGPYADYLYLTANQMFQSCVPNCTWVISRRPDFKIRIRTAVDVKKGEQLTLNYLMVGATKHTHYRFDAVLARQGIRCKCLRCSDPTELGTFMSAVACINCHKITNDSVGYLLPEEPVNLDPKSRWRCNSCGVRKPFDAIYSGNELSLEMTKMVKECSRTNDIGTLINHCKMLVSEASGKTVHPNHWRIQSAIRTVIECLYTHCEVSMDLETSQYFVKCGLYLLAIQDIVSPGITFDRAILQKRIASALQGQVTQLCSLKKHKDALDNLERCLELQEKALDYFKDDFPDNHVELSNADQLRLSMQKAKRSRDEIAGMMADEFRCIVCKKEAHQSCLDCHLVFYCSTEHRQKHWKTHKKTCASFEIKEGSTTGNGFFATRDIEAGVISLEEKPVLYAPSWNIPEFGSAFCVTCGVELGLRDVMNPKNRCTKCNWPSCSLGCYLIHTENECKIFETAGPKLNFPPVGHFIPKDIRDLVLLIRATILKKKLPGVYQQILGLRSESTESENNDYNLEARWRLLGPYVNSDGANLSQEEFKKLFKIVRMNSHSTSTDPSILQPNAQTNTSNPKSDYLYLKASKLSQSCVPNCSWEIGGKPDFKIQIRTRKAVKKGQPLTIDYNVEGWKQGTKERQQKIRKARGEWCTCERCTDPTELGTFASAITCSTCRAVEEGTTSEFRHLLPEDPLDLSESARWKCNHCGQLKLSSVILPPVEKIGKLISKQVKACNDEGDIRSLISYCETVLTKYNGKSLHPNHWVLQEATRIIFMQKIAGCERYVDLDTSLYFSKLGLHLLAIQNIVSPGLSTARAILQKPVATALQYQAVELYSRTKYTEALAKIDECLALLAELLKYAQFLISESSKEQPSESKTLKRDMDKATKMRSMILAKK